MRRFLKLIIIAFLTALGIFWYAETRKRRTMIPLEFRGE